MTDKPTTAPVEVQVLDPATGRVLTGAEVLALNDAAKREQEAKTTTPTSQRARIKLVPTDDVEAMKNILESIQEVNEQFPTFDVSSLVNQLVDAILDLPEADYARFGHKIAALFNDVVKIRKEEEGEPFLILKAGELGEHVTLEEFRRYEASAALHEKINTALTKAGARPIHTIPAMSPTSFSVVRRIHDAPAEIVGAESVGEAKARELAEYKRLKDLAAAVDLVPTNEEPKALTLEELAGIQPGGGAVEASNDLEIRVKNLESGIRQLHEDNATFLERSMREREELNTKLAEILKQVSKEA